MEEGEIKETTLEEISRGLPAAEGSRAEALIREWLGRTRRKIVVLDDDPTGVQTVHDVPVYTGWDGDSIRAVFDDDSPLVFILTNSRGLPAEETKKLHAVIGERIAGAGKERNLDFVLISRSDSTLRGHYPLETETLRERIESITERPFDGEIICPFFLEGGRYTRGNVHYVKTGEKLVPAARTEFAEDRTFGYAHSDLCRWIEEKTGGAFPAGAVTSLSLEDLRYGGIERLTGLLLGVRNFGKVVVNALDYADIKVFCAAFCAALDRGKRFIFRSAAAVPKVLGGIGDRPLLGREELLGPDMPENRDNRRGGLILVGSHVKKTTRQLELLLERRDIEGLEFNPHTVLEEPGFRNEIDRVQGLCERNLAAGKTVAVFTSRKRFDLNSGSGEDELRVSLKIAAAVTGFVANLREKPKFILAKGGITSSEIGTKALGVKKALVLGQVLPGIPVWLTGKESRFPNTPYIIFPGNVGEEESLRRIVDLLSPVPYNRVV
jgi:uncharacterized protein YgbK (DUF1537 family)